jgi:hypothetical protein
VFPARYELNSYIVFRKRLVSKRLTTMQCHISVKSIKGGKSKCHWIGSLLKSHKKKKKSTDSSDSVSDNERRPT